MNTKLVRFADNTNYLRIMKRARNPHWRTYYVEHYVLSGRSIVRKGVQPHKCYYLLIYLYTSIQSNSISFGCPKEYEAVKAAEKVN